jgi:ribulose-phosphate 3-epimerase
MTSRHGIKIAASILPVDFTRLGDQLAEAEQAGVDRVHVDVMDGHFVPNISFGPVILRAVRAAVTLPLGAHLMMLQPERFLSEFVSAGSDWIIVHVETCPHLHRVVQQIKDLGAKPGVAINPATPAEHLVEILEYVDGVLVMTVNPGFGGQKFIDSMQHKIRRIRHMLNERGLNADLMVDGGINSDTAPLVVAAGANVLGMGSAVFNDKESVAEACARVRTSIEGAPEVFEE